MNWYNIYKISSIVPEIDPRLMEAAKLVVDGGKNYIEIANKYGFEPRGEFMDVILELRRIKDLKGEKIASLMDKVKSSTKVSEIMHIDYDDVVWVLRRLRPQYKINITEKELNKAIQMLENGNAMDSISKKIRVSVNGIRERIKTVRPDLIRDVLSKSELDNAYIKFLYLLDNGKTSSEAINTLSQQ